MSASQQTSPEVRELALALQAVVGERCLYAIASPVGSAIDLHFGKKRPRPQPLELPFLNRDQRLNEGEVSIYVECTWRLDFVEGVVCGCWEDSTTENAPVRAGLARLVGKKLSSFEISMPALDLILHFDNQMSLRVFCDQTNMVEGGDNYTVYTRTREHTVTTRSGVEAHDVPS